jgi:hypothetical protein
MPQFAGCEEQQQHETTGWPSTLDYPDNILDPDLRTYACAQVALVRVAQHLDVRLGVAVHDEVQAGQRCIRVLYTCGTSNVTCCRPFARYI